MRTWLALGVALLCYGCGSNPRVPLKPYYAPVELSPGDVVMRLDVPYRADSDADLSKHRLDLYLPPGSGWPLLGFVHGGSLEKGDSAKRVAGHDIYRNIGRFYASRGVGVALINYRLQPEVHWPQQVDDVAVATSWLLEQATVLGGDGRVFLSGHSAGSWLATRVALDQTLQQRHGFSGEALAGVISVSGSGFDLTDQPTWEMFGRERKWRRRFSTGDDDTNWKRQASVVPLIEAPAPPFLLLYSSDEYPALARQNRLFFNALMMAGVPCELEEIDGLGHRRMLLAMSHAERPLAHRILHTLGIEP